MLRVKIQVLSRLFRLPHEAPPDLLPPVREDILLPGTAVACPRSPLTAILLSARHLFLSCPSLQMAVTSVVPCTGQGS